MENFKKYRIGYTQGTFDMFHIGHLNLLRQAKEKCEKLIVGVNSDKLVQMYKNKTPVVNEQDRLKIVNAIKYVDDVIICDTLKKTSIWEELKFNAIFIGSDWKGDSRWKQTELDLAPLGVDVVYLQHTDGISSTMLRKYESKKVDDNNDIVN